MIRAYLFALDPTDQQADAMRSHCGAQRVAYNWCLARVLANWAQRSAEQTYGLTGEQLTPWIDTSAYSLRKAWNAAKEQVAPWWAENSKEAYASGCANLSTALGNRKAGRARMPRFKSKRRARLTCRFTTGAFGLGPDCRHIRLPVIGLVRTHESTRELTRHVEAGTARIRSVTLSFQRGRWHGSFSVELPDPVPTERTRGRVVGVDLGIKSLAVLSTGETVPNPRHLDLAQKALRRTQRACARRRGPDRRTRVEPSNRWRKSRARADRIHTRVANLRRDTIHQLTTRLVREFDVIAIEDLAVANMIRNRRLARRIADASWAEIRRQLTYKTQRTGAELIVADRWFASSKTCSGCGAAKAKLALSERTHACVECGIVLDRDVNAAINLAALAADRAQLVREQPEGTGVRRPLADAVGPPREEPPAQPHRREMVSR
ncbi:IS607 family element RNA-guided endonuclease TnpB [Actinokineospora spheciospongiae]|uniref:IS607 family element RNA-guided endonuclease TnpB n=1 Tax=Actinokineospora spheciospongiae TaxID=909613 RepID=UPI000D70AAF2|nr:IS607 family element RNA-guided endonuclease TnpB [Actinokineospora spheciospongiae]PWW65859.1 transposase [Actinokineospora spheciospongiae]